MTTPVLSAKPALSTLLDLDARDPLQHKKAQFVLPEGVIYLDGNSLGALPATVPARLERVIHQEWGDALIRSWTAHAQEGRDWMALPDRVAAKLAPLIGAEASEISVGDSTSVNLFKALTAALDVASPGRRVILTDADNFPTDLYVAQGLNGLLDGRYELRRVPAAELSAHLTTDVAAMMVTEVDYRTGERLDMASLTAQAHAQGIVTIWDLAHSAGAFEVDLTAARADFAVGCGYKYLNGGPGAPGYLFVASRHLQARVALSGWMGHADPFEMARDYTPAKDARRFIVGTPTVLSLSALDTALDVFADVDLKQLRAKSLALTDTFMALVAGDPDLTLVTPLDHARRGSQVSFRHPQAREAMRRLVERGVIGDFRTPDILRFGFTPLYVSYADVYRAAQAVLDVAGELRA
ncbi:kynureninase [Deinococcus deserti]|uniref:Kynureninase n=1 Tax=Deinococcus deserti (strain DSM 17065 / CIP 109153 / LMG 22923 / VCD115) TaxID=546414 RepID=C1D325_DEIDV|nr:kynureninase [Deinococcus deserti]ACO47814.1 putative kynureninase (L-kynurenine hydrolase) [Deinococcus deserti VCD115]